MKQRKKLPLVGKRWIINDWGHVQFTDGSEAVVLNEGVEMDGVVLNLRKAKVKGALKKAGIDVETIISKTETVPLATLRTLPADLHEEIGFTVVARTSASLKLDQNKLQKMLDNSSSTRRKVT